MLCHKYIRKIAKEIAGAGYELMAKDDFFYTEFPNQKVFIEKNWGKFVPAARESLLKILAGDYPEAMKEETLEIFLQDKTLQAVNNLQVQGTA